jgi:hypothetical protein
MTGMGLAAMTTRGDEMPMHPVPFVTVTSYVPDVITVMACVDAPVLHVYELADDEVSVTESPRQNVVGPFGVTTGVGFAFTVTVTAVALPMHPLLLVTNTLNVPGVVTVIACVVAPLLQK